jgi:hypothetical protein
MLDRGKDLSATRTEDDQDLKPDFTYEELQKEIWADLDAIFDYPVREPGDIDADQISTHYGVHQNTARGRMERMVASGEYEFVIVQDETSGTGRRRIIRKIGKK